MGESYMVAGLSFGVMLILIFGGMPIFAAMGLVGIAGLIVDTGFFHAMSFTQSLPYATLASYGLAVIALFFLMGNLVSESGMAAEAFDCSHKLLGNFPGGLAMATTLASGLSAAAMGSSTANAAVFTRIALPEMIRFGYDKRFSLGVIACTGTFAIMIPPSVLLVLYGTLTEESIGKLLIAGVFPGTLTLVTYLCAIWVRCSLNPALGPRSGVRVALKEKLHSIERVWGVLVLFVLVLGGIYFGFFTPTVGGAVGAFGAMIIAIIKGKFGKDMIANTSLNTTEGITSIMVLLVGGFLFAKHLVLCGFIDDLVSLVTQRIDQPYWVITAICAMYLVMGCFMSTMSVLVITVPIFYPVVIALGFSGVWFGIVCTKLVEIAMVTPPIGGNIFVVTQVAGKDTRTVDVVHGIWPFVAMDLIVLLLLILFPSIATYLPSRMYGQ